MGRRSVGWLLLTVVACSRGSGATTSPDGSGILDGAAGGDGAEEVGGLPDAGGATGASGLTPVRLLSPATSQVAFAASAPRLLAAGTMSTIVDTGSWSLLRTFSGHASFGVVAAISADGTIGASLGGDALRVWRTADGAELASTTKVAIPTNGQGTLALSPDGSRIALGDPAFAVRLYDRSSLARLWTSAPAAAPIASLQFTPDGGTILAGTTDQFLVLATADGAPRTPLSVPGTDGYGVLSGDGRLLAAVTRSSVALVTVADGKLAKTIPMAPLSATSVALSHDGSRLAVGLSAAVSVVDTASNAPTASLPVQSAASLAFSPDDSELAVAADGLQVWRVSDGTKLFDAGSGRSPSALSPTRSAVASAGDSNDVIVWDPEQGKIIRTFESFNSPVATIAFDSAGRLLLDANDVSTLWDLTEPSPLRTVNYVSPTQPPEWSGSLLLTPDGTLLVGKGDGASYGDVRIWNATTGALVRRFAAHAFTLSGMALDRTGTILATGGAETAPPTDFDPPGGIAIKLWDFGTGTLRRTLVGHVDAVGSLAFSPTGDRLLSAGSDGLVRLWSVADGSVERDFAPVVAGSYSVKYGSGASFSPDGRWAASGGFAAAYGGSTVIGIWSVADGTLARQLIAPADGYGGGAAWSPDGQVMLGGGGGGLYVWNVQDLAAARP